MIGDFAAIPPEEAGALLTIDLDALAFNWRLLRDRVQGADCAAVVKANAYGIGIEMAVPKLLESGCRTYYVAHLAEARRVRALTGDAVIYVLNGFLAGTAPIYAAHGPGARCWARARRLWNGANTLPRIRMRRQQRSISIPA